MWFFAWFFAGLFAGVLLGFFLAGLCNISAKKKERYIGSGPDSEKKIEDAA
jgi:Na+/H+-dicarboxylate symporter